MNKHIVSGLMVFFAIAVAGPAAAKDEKLNHGKVAQVATQAPNASGEVATVGVINSVDAASGKVNFTHEPIKELGWPTMTMDLEVTKRVDLSTVKPGSNAKFKLKLGRDKQYRITEIEPK